jgi:ABC-type xylose transport system permease subunit
LGLPELAQIPTQLAMVSLVGACEPFWFNYRKVPSPISTFADPCGKNSADLG